MLATRPSRGPEKRESLLPVFLSLNGTDFLSQIF
jgi:hypothetical protein